MTFGSRWLIALLLWLPVGVRAASLGAASVQSYVGQPLHLEVAVHGVGAAGLRATDVRVGGAKLFSSMSMADMPLLHHLQLSTRRQTDGVWIIDIRSRGAIANTYLEFPLVVDVAGQHLVKGVSVLLNPPAYRGATVQPRRVSTSAVRPSKQATPGGVYWVHPGDTLVSIARRFKPPHYPTFRMTRDIFRANPEAFVDGDINRLRVGSRLLIPAVGNARRAAGQPARDVAERQRGAAGPAGGKRQTVRQTGAAAKQKKPVEQAEEQGRLHVLQTQMGTNAKATPEQLQRDLMLTRENMEQALLEKQQVKARLASVREDVADMQQVLALKDEQIAAVRKVAQAQAAAQQATDRLKLAEKNPVPLKKLPKAKPKRPESPYATLINWLVWLFFLASAGVLGVVLARQRRPRAADPLAAAGGSPGPTVRMRRIVIAVQRWLTRMLRATWGTARPRLTQFSARLARELTLLRARLSRGGGGRGRARFTAASQRIVRRLADWRLAGAVWLARRRGAAGDCEGWLEMARASADLGDLFLAGKYCERALVVAANPAQRRRVLEVRARLIG